MILKAAALIGAAGLLAYGAWVMLRDKTSQGAGAAIESAAETLADVGDSIVGKTVNLLQMWRAPEQYAGLIRQAEIRHGIPLMMLERLLYQESRYRADIIDGSTRSKAGAMGIAQFMPATAAEMNINPLEPAQAIDAAGRYLRRLFDRFGNWSEALAAYNWGQGNVSRKGLAAAPRETRLYYSQILADVNNTGGTSLA